MEIEYRIKGFPYLLRQTVEKFLLVCPKCKEPYQIHEERIKEDIEHYNEHYQGCTP